MADKPTLTAVQRRVRALAKELDEQADALDVRSYDPMPLMTRTPDGPVPDWNRTAARNRELRIQAVEKRELAAKLRRAATKGE